MNLTISSASLSDDARIIRISGEIDIYSSTELKQEVTVCLARGVRILMLDLTDVEYVDSTGLGLMIGALKRLRETQGKLILINPSVRLLRVFEITGLDRVFDICASEREAVEKENLHL